MSDTITPEERAELRELADKSYLLPLNEDEVPSVGFDGLTDERIAYIAAACNSVPRILDALEQVEVRAEKAEAENARLRPELETAKQVAASAQAVAQEAWAGEIPSPLPGHKRANEEELLAQVEHLNCPLCGGSGHIGDCEGD